MRYLYSYLKIVVTLILTYLFFSSMTYAQSHFQTISPSTYLAMNIYVIQADLAGSGSLGTGDEIGIFDGEKCVGAALLSGPIDPLVPLAMIASRDDPTTQELDGFIEGNPISYKFWISATSIEYDQYVVNYTLGNGTFASLGTALVEIASILPVELTSFSAIVENKIVILKWETATEVNNYGFDIERKSEDGSWVKLGFIEGHGNSNSPKQYSFNDGNPIGGRKFFYRLKQIDTDGQYEYSDVVEVEIVPNEFALLQNYPNPFNNSTVIKYSIPKEGLVTLKVYNLLGEEVARLINDTKQTGNYEVSFDATGLTSGIYLYRLQAGNFVETKKMILLQ